MVWPELSVYGDWALLALRLMVAAIFFTSGLSHVKDPKKRAESIGMSPAFTLFLGAAEMAGALGLASGVLIRPAAVGLILVMLGAIQKKVMVWKTGFWDAKGWHYDLLLLVVNLVFATLGAGRLSIG